MPLTRDFKETIQARVKNDPAFRERLLSEALDSFISGDVETGKIVLRDYINATLGFDELAKVTKKSPKSLCVCSVTRATRRLATSLASLHIFKRKNAFA